MMGEAQPAPTPRPHSSFGGQPPGKPELSEVMPLRLGPRHCGQSAPAAAPAARSSAAPVSISGRHLLRDVLANPLMVV